MRLLTIPALAFLALLLGCPEADDDSAADDDDATEEIDYTQSPCYGDARITQLFDHATMSFIDLETTCRAEDDGLLVYVQDDIWDEQVTQEEVDAFTFALARHAPEGALDPDTGILWNDIAVFGEPDWEALQQEKVAFFLVDTDGRGDGYLCSWCDDWDGGVLHIDAVVRPPTEDATLAVTAHELVHLIEQSFDSAEEPWVSESLAQSGMTINGFYTDQAWVEGWLETPDVSWGPDNEEHGYLDYGAALLLGTWWMETQGTEGLAAILQDSHHGWAGVLPHTGELDDPPSMWNSFALYAWREAWTTIDFGPPHALAPLEADGYRTSTTSMWGVDFLPLEAAGTVDVTIDGPGWFLYGGEGLQGEVAVGSATVEVPGPDPVIIFSGDGDFSWEVEAL